MTHWSTIQSFLSYSYVKTFTAYVQLWGTAKFSNIEIYEGFNLAVTSAPWFESIAIIPHDLTMLRICKDGRRAMSKYLTNLEVHFKPLALNFLDIVLKRIA